MINEKTNTKISKFLSLVLRHAPEQLGLELDTAGWANVTDLLFKMNAKGQPIDFDTLVHITPPEILYHGTGEKSIDSILKTGIEKRNRHHVHLSADIDTALKVGQRHGKPVILEVMAKEMLAKSHVFYISENKVWLTDFVPAEFLRLKVD